MTLTVQQQQILDLICSSGGGMKVRDLEIQTDMTYKTIIKAARELIAKGYQIRGISAGDWIERLFLSPYDTKYKTLINN